MFRVPTPNHCFGECSGIVDKGGVKFHMYILVCFRCCSSRLFLTRPFCSSLLIVSALLVVCSASVRRLFLLFLSINRFSSCQFRSCLSTLFVSALLVTRSASVCRLFLLFSSINRFSSRQFRSSILSTLLFLLF